ncbi:MAG TPA: HEAT repeat domain-containing protein, partial [Thermoanaerobaculia bacterium]|nr:HEAT repeat domain-containing protein [Thermoanaerobaculia bacterium]
DRIVSFERRVVDALTTALRAPDPRLRRIAIEALGRIGSPKPAYALLTLLELEDADSSERRMAAEALMLLDGGGQAVISVLLGGSRRSREITAVAIATYVGGFDVSRPWRARGWFRVSTDAIAFDSIDAITGIVEALIWVRREHAPHFDVVVRPALEEIADKLAERRLRGPRDGSEDEVRLLRYLRLVEERARWAIVGEEAWPAAPRMSRSTPSQPSSDAAPTLPPAVSASADHAPARRRRAAHDLAPATPAVPAVPAASAASAVPADSAAPAAARRWARKLVDFLGEVVVAGFGGLAMAVGRSEPREAPAAAATEPEPESRFTDLTFLERLRSPVREGQALRAGEWYFLEVAVRVRPSGIPPAKAARQPLVELGRTTDIILHVTVEGDGFDVDEPVDTLVLPAVGDSTKPALFRVRPARETTNSGRLAELRVHLYYRFNLLEELVVQAKVVGRFDEPLESEPGVAVPISFRQTRLERDYVDLRNLLPRALHVNVDFDLTGFQFRFVFSDAKSRQVEFAACAPLALTDLEDFLVRVRKAWRDIALGKTFAVRVEAGHAEFVDMVWHLAKIGRELWIKLFKHETDSAMYRIGSWILENPPEVGSLVQISLSQRAKRFTLPWALLYDRPLPARSYDLPDLDGFWGMRYVIEQQPPSTKRSDLPLEVPRGIDLAFMQWDRFRNIKEQDKLMEELAGESAGRFRSSQPPIGDAEACYQLLRGEAADILYFFAHGFTRGPGVDSDVARELEELKVWLRKRALDSPQIVHVDWLAEGADDPLVQRSWIELTRGRLFLDDLYDQVAQIQRRPLVFLNLCESAQVRPALADSFVHFFLDRGSVAVLGTECPMTIEFAHPFSAFLLREILVGRQLGVALLAARQHFMRHHCNPLALAYSLFGLATTAFKPPALQKNKPEGEFHANVA